MAVIVAQAADASTVRLCLLDEREHVRRWWHVLWDEFSTLDHLKRLSSTTPSLDDGLAPKINSAFQNHRIRGSGQ